MIPSAGEPGSKLTTPPLATSGFATQRLNRDFRALATIMMWLKKPSVSGGLTVTCAQWMNRIVLSDSRHANSEARTHSQILSDCGDCVTKVNYCQQLRRRLQMSWPGHSFSRQMLLRPFRRTKMPGTTIGSFQLRTSALGWRTSTQPGDGQRNSPDDSIVSFQPQLRTNSWDSAGLRRITNPAYRANRSC
jgi:hypothetical protein